MIQVRKSHERGLAEQGWLKSRHTFSFGDYYDEKHMGFSVLRVINEDRILGGTGFGSHPHREMEILSYVIEGALEHKDSMGNATIIKPGEVQRMTAGTGIRHSEHNHLPHQETHFLQIWILPQKPHAEPSYDQKSFADGLKGGDLLLVASQNGRLGSVSLNQDVDMYAVQSEQSGKNIMKTSVHRHFWVQVIQGEVHVDDAILTAGDGAGVSKVEELRLQWSKGSAFILFDLP